MKLGQELTFTRTLRRVKDANGKVTWVPVPHPPQSGVFVGWRTLSLGHVIWHEYAEWRRTGSVKAALVATHLHKSPVYIPRDDAVAPNPNCALCHGTGMLYEDVAGDGGSRMPTTCECVE